MNTFWQSLRFDMGSVKNFVFIFLAIVFAGCSSETQSTAKAHSAPDLLFNYHFAGTETLFKGTNLVLEKVWELPESVQLRENILQKLAETPEQLFGKASGKTDTASLLRPLLNDLLAAESLAEVRRGTNAPGEVVIAVRLNKDRVGLWETNLQKVVAEFSQGKVESTKWEKFNGWEVQQSGNTNLIRSIWTGDWLVIGIGHKELPLQNNMLRRLSSGNAPVDWKGKTNWFETTLDVPRLREWLPLENLPFKPAITDIALSTKGGSVKTVLRAKYPKPLNWKAHKWQIPTNVIRDPLISFTAAQNLSVLVKSPETLAKTGSDPLASQYFLWAQSGLPFMSFGAMPVENSQKTFDQLSGRLPQLFNAELQRTNAGKLVLSADKKSLLWSGLSMIVPHLMATNEPAGEFIFAGLFLPPPSNRTPPPELIEQVSSRTNLIYYDWEITQFRLGHWQMLSKIVPFLKIKMLPISPELIEQAKKDEALRKQLTQRLQHERWQSKVAPLLGNTITEVSLVAPNEIEFVRVSHCGFTGVELVYLSAWLNDPRFPLFKETPAATKK